VDKRGLQRHAMIPYIPIERIKPKMLRIALIFSGKRLTRILTFTCMRFVAAHPSAGKMMITIIILVISVVPVMGLLKKYRPPTSHTVSIIMKNIIIQDI